MLHDDVAVGAVAHERSRARVAGVLAVCCDYGRIDNDSRVTHAIATVLLAWGLCCLLLALGPANVVDEAGIVHAPEVAAVDGGDGVRILGRYVGEGLQGRRSVGDSREKRKAALCEVCAHDVEPERAYLAEWRVARALGLGPGRIGRDGAFVERGAIPC